MRISMKRAIWRLAAAASGTVLFLEGCDPQLRSTLESGIITSSSSLLGSILRTWLELGQEAAADTTSARVIIDAARQFFA